MKQTPQNNRRRQPSNQRPPSRSGPQDPNRSLPPQGPSPSGGQRLRQSQTLPRNQSRGFGGGLFGTPRGRGAPRGRSPQQGRGGRMTPSPQQGRGGRMTPSPQQGRGSPMQRGGQRRASGFGGLFGPAGGRSSMRNIPMRSQPNTPTDRRPPRDMSHSQTTPNLSRPSRPDDLSLEPQIGEARAPDNQGQPQRQMGRRTGNLRRKNPDHPHNTMSRSISMQPGTPGSQNPGPSPNSMMQDMFLDSINKPPKPTSVSTSNLIRRASDDSLGRAQGNGPEDPGLGDRNKPLRKSTASIGRTDSYKRAKNAAVFDEAAQPNLARQGRHSSLPRLNNRNKDRAGVPPRSKDDLDTRSLDRSKSMSGKPDPCKVM